MLGTNTGLFDLMLYIEEKILNSTDSSLIKQFISLPYKDLTKSVVFINFIIYKCTWQEKILCPFLLDDFTLKAYAYTREH